MVWPQHRSFDAGIAVGGALAVYLAFAAMAPEHIERWRRGSEAEKWTAKELKSLPQGEWAVEHDRSARYGNRDHILVGLAGVFLLDT